MTDRPTSQQTDIRVHIEVLLFCTFTVGLEEDEEEVYGESRKFNFN